MATAKYVINFFVEQEMYDAIEKVRASLHMSKSEFMRHAINMALPERLTLSQTKPGRPKAEKPEVTASNGKCPYCGEPTTGADCRVSTDQGHVWVHIPCYEQAKYILPA